jgi:hypothetical protein
VCSQNDDLLQINSSRKEEGEKGGTEEVGIRNSKGILAASYQRKRDGY